MNSNENIDNLKAEILRLNEKISAMRSLLWEWNATSDNVWEYYRLKQVGEREEDYAFLVDEYEPDMPLFDGDDDRDFMERL